MKLAAWDYSEFTGSGFIVEACDLDAMSWQQVLVWFQGSSSCRISTGEWIVHFIVNQSVPLAMLAGHDPCPKYQTL